MPLKYTNHLISSKFSSMSKGNALGQAVDVSTKQTTDLGSAVKLLKVKTIN